MSISVLNVLAANSPAVSACQQPAVSHIFLAFCLTVIRKLDLACFHCLQRLPHALRATKEASGKGSTRLYPVHTSTFEKKLYFKGKNMDYFRKITRNYTYKRIVYTKTESRSLKFKMKYNIIFYKIFQNKLDIV